MTNPFIDTSEYPDDLRRQDEEFLRTRIDDYFGLYHSVAARLTQPDQYSRADLVRDSWQLWGMMWRDSVDAGLRAVRTMNRIAEDTPVPTEPNRRLSEPFTFTAPGRPLHVECTDLVAASLLPDGTVVDRVVSAAEVELSPNPVLDAGTTSVTITINAAAHRGTYRGDLLLFGADPTTPIETIPIAIWSPGAFDRV